MESGHNEELEFRFKFGFKTDFVRIAISDLNLKTLKDLACDFMKQKFPNNSMSISSDQLMLFKHNYESSNILQIVNSVTEISHETIVEIVLTEVPAATVESNITQMHILNVHSYKVPTFCDFCGEMLFGLVRQGVKCEGCGQNYHKRCVVKVPKNCVQATNCNLNITNNNSFGGEKQRKRSSGNLNTRPLVVTERSPSEYSNDSNASVNVQQKMTASIETLENCLKTLNISIPHTFVKHSYTRPTICHHCKKLLKGLFKQGFQCKDCHCNAHKNCIDFIPKDCFGEISSTALAKLGSAANLNDSSSNDEMGSQKNHDLDDDDEDDDDDEEDEDEESNKRSRMQSDVEPTTESINNNRHNNDDDDCDSKVSFDRIIPDRFLFRSSSSSLSSPSANIPLMRVIQSVKHTRKQRTDVIKEGWLTHFTNRDFNIRRHYWRLYSKSIVMFQNEQETKYFKEILLSDIREIEKAKSKISCVQHCFEIHTPKVVYFVGQDPVCDLFDNRQLDLPPLDSGVGAYLALSWETAIRQTVDPLSNQNNDFLNGNTEKENSITNIHVLFDIFWDEILGSGQFGIVHGGVHKTTMRPVAVKVIDKLRFPHKQEAQLKNEVSILQNLNHPGVVNLERTFETNDKIFVVMEKLTGDMLEMILSQAESRLNERTTKFLITQILIALKYLHNKNIVHCDLKPENVLLSSNDEFPQVKLCDFGFARIIGEKSFRRSVVGTPAYLAPEVLRNKGYNRSLDMWSVGVIIYVSLSGTFPFNEDEDINEQIQNAAFMYPPCPWKDISNDAIDLINSLLQVKQRKRFTVNKTLQHIWLHDYQTWLDLRLLEKKVGDRYLTHESDDLHWESIQSI